MSMLRAPTQSRSSHQTCLVSPLAAARPPGKVVFQTAAGTELALVQVIAVQEAYMAGGLAAASGSEEEGTHSAAWSCT